MTKRHNKSFGKFGKFWSEKNYLKSSVRKMTTMIERREKLLQSLQHDPLAQEIMQDLCKQSVSRRPVLIAEKELLDRVKATPLKRFIKPHKLPIDIAEFDEQLDKAEEEMVNPAKFQGSVDRLDDATLRVLRNCKFPTDKFYPASPRYAAENQINKRASSGFPSFQRKGRILETIIDQAEAVLSGEYLEIFNWPIIRGFRIQQRESEGDVKIKTRVMYPYPGAITLIEDTFLLPFVNHFASTDTFYLMGRTGAQISDLIRKEFNDPKIGRITTTDFTGFDQHVLNECIFRAFWILRSRLKLTKSQSIAWDQMVLYFCQSYAVSRKSGQDVYSFIKVKGVPSGSGFTNMIDTLVHAIMLEYYRKDITAKRCLLCGDDSLLDSSHININKLSEIMKFSFNMILTPEKTMHFKHWSSIKFLGFKWINGKRQVSPRLVINQLIYHSDYINADVLTPFDRTLSRAASVLLNGENGKYLFKQIFPEVYQQVMAGRDRTFFYLYGTQPPTTLAPITKEFKVSKADAPPGFTASLREHLEHGHAIR